MDGFCPKNFPKSTKTQRNKQIMRQRSAVFPHIVLRLTRNSPLGCKFVCTSAAFNLKRVPGALSSVSLIKLNRALSIYLLCSPIYAMFKWAFPQGSGSSIFMKL